MCRVNGEERTRRRRRARGEKRKGERGGTKIPIERAWNSPFLTGRDANPPRDFGARKQDERGAWSQTYRCYAIRSVFLSIGIRDLHSGPVTISIDTRAKTAHGRPPLIKADQRPGDRRIREDRELYSPAKLSSHLVIFVVPRHLVLVNVVGKEREDLVSTPLNFVLGLEREE